MTITSGQTGFAGISRLQVSHSDLVRSWVIASITISIIGITYIAMSAGYGAIVPQIFYFPILYATYFYPRRGLYVGGICAVAYLFIAYSSVTHDPIIISGIIFQALLFIIIAAGSGCMCSDQRTLSSTMFPRRRTMRSKQ
jgi:hypothetical protein